MKKSVPASTPDEYISGLRGWQWECVEHLRSAIFAASDPQEMIKWGHLVYFSEGPAFLIRAEEERVLFGFWRGKRLREIEPRLKPGGKYEMATIELREGDSVALEVVHRLVRGAIALNAELGDPRSDAKGGKRNEG